MDADRNSPQTREAEMGRGGRTGTFTFQGPPPLFPLPLQTLGRDKLSANSAEEPKISEAITKMAKVVLSSILIIMVLAAIYGCGGSGGSGSSGTGGNSSSGSLTGSGK